MSCRFVCSLVSSFFNADCVRVLVYAFTSMSLFCCYCHCGCYCGNSCVVVVCSRCLLLHCVYCWRRVTHLMKFLLLTASPPTSTIATIIIIAGQRSFQDCVNCVWRYTVDQRVCAFALFVRPSVPCLLVDSILVYFFRRLIELHVLIYEQLSQLHRLLLFRRLCGLHLLFTLHSDAVAILYWCWYFPHKLPLSFWCTPHEFTYRIDDGSAYKIEPWIMKARSCGDVCDAFIVCKVA